MRTTLRIPDEILRRAKQEAARRGTSLTNMVNDALVAYLAHEVRDARETSLPVGGKGGLQGGVDLDDSAALSDLMDSE